MSRPLKRVGHKGADLIAPGNTPASFDAALEAGVDMIELDLLSERVDGSGHVFCAHDFEVLAERPRVTLDEALDHLAGPPFAGVELDVDLKLPGYEARVLDGLRERGLLERTLISTMEPPSLRAVRALAPEVRLGWSVPRIRKDPFARRATRIPAYALAAGYRAALPRRAAAALRAGRCDALMAHHRLVTPALVRAVQGAGGALYVWTVDDAARIAALAALGVDGVITNDPRLFAAAGLAAPTSASSPA